MASVCVAAAQHFIDSRANLREAWNKHPLEPLADDIENAKLDNAVAGFEFDMRCPPRVVRATYRLTAPLFKNPGILPEPADKKVSAIRHINPKSRNAYETMKRELQKP
jgi:hypothetical protein